MAPIEIAGILLLVDGALGAFDTFCDHERVEHLPAGLITLFDLVVEDGRADRAGGGALPVALGTAERLHGRDRDLALRDGWASRREARVAAQLRTGAHA